MAAGGGCRQALTFLALALVLPLGPLGGPYAAFTAAARHPQPGGGTGSASARRSVSAAPRYSQLQCAGGAGPQTGIDGTEDYYSCLLLDVCYDTGNRALLYYTDGSPVLVDDGFKYNFTEPIALLEAESVCKSTMTPTAVLGPVPDGAVYSSATTTVLLNLLYPFNVGTFMYDNMFAIFRALELYGRADAIPNHLQLLFKETCHETCTRNHPADNFKQWCAGYAASMCEEFKRDLLPTMTSLPSLEPGKPELDRTPVLCFKELIVGLADYAVWSYDHNNMRSFHDKVLDQAVPDWRQRVQARQANPATRKLRLTVCNDNGPHKSKGLEEALAYVGAQMPDIIIDLKQPSTMTFKQQLEHVVDTDILVSSCSAMAHQGFFLRPSSAAIVITTLDYHKNQPSRGEDLLWRQVGNVLVQPYYFVKDEVFIPDKVEPASDVNDPPTLYTQHGRVIMNATRLLTMVRGAASWIRGETTPAALAPAPAPAAAPKAYSQMHCTGGHDTQSGMGVGAIKHHPTCLMRDVCYDSTADKLLFYTDGSPIFIDYEGFHYNFTRPLLQMEPVSPIGSILTPVAVHGPVPHGATYSAAPLGVLMNLHYPFNVGHFMYDNLLAVYRSLDLFDRTSAVPSGMQLVFASDCMQTCQRAYPGDGIIPWCKAIANPDCEKYKRMLVPTVSDYPYLERGIPELDRNPVMCFKELLVGLADFAMWTTDSTNLRHFHDAILHRIVPDFKMRTHRRLTGGGAFATVAEAAATRPLRMVVYVKRGRRAPIGLLEAVAAFGDKVPGLLVNITDPATMTFQQQLEQMVETDILLSPCGGTSMTGLFLQPGSSAIIIEFFNTNRNRSWPMEGNMWRQLSGVLTRHYFFGKDEVVLPQGDHINPPSDAWDPYLLYRNHGQVIINPERLLEIVKGVVSWIRRDAGRMARSDKGLIQQGT